jgi:hypothetical protein
LQDELFLKEEREDDVLGEIDYLDVVPPQYDTSPINDEEQHFDDLADLSDAILSGKQQHLGKLFQVDSPIRSGELITPHPLQYIQASI